MCCLNQGLAISDQLNGWCALVGEDIIQAWGELLVGPITIRMGKDGAWIIMEYQLSRLQTMTDSKSNPLNFTYLIAVEAKRDLKGCVCVL